MDMGIWSLEVARQITKHKCYLATGGRGQEPGYNLCAFLPRAEAKRCPLCQAHIVDVASLLRQSSKKEVS